MPKFVIARASEQPRTACRATPSIPRLRRMTPARPVTSFGAARGAGAGDVGGASSTPTRTASCPSGSTTRSRSRIRRRCGSSPATASSPRRSTPAAWTRPASSGPRDRIRRPGRSSSKAPSPGDVLVVTIEKIETNRATGLLEQPAGAVCGRSRPRSPDGRTARRAGSTGASTRPPAPPRSPRPTSARRSRLPLRPMLGCVGVAPARKEAWSTATPGAYGGNMDYAGLTAGREGDAAGERARRAALHRRRPRPAGRGRGGGHRPRDVDGRRVHGRAGEEEGDRLAAPRERHPPDDAGQRAAAAAGAAARHQPRCSAG